MISVIMGRTLFGFCLILFFGFCVTFENEFSINLKNGQKTKYTIEKGKNSDSIVWGKFSNLINQTGWGFLTLTTNENDLYSSDLQAYMAGVLESVLTHETISMHWKNTIEGYCKKPYTSYCKKLRTFLEKNLIWVYEQIKLKASSSPYWYQLKLILMQYNGLEAGYSLMKNNADLHSFSANLTYKVTDVFGFYLFLVGGDLEDLETVLKVPKEKRKFGGGHCSALIKLLPGNTDLFFSHVTWSSLESMLRVLKLYNFAFKMTPTSKEIIPGRSMSFSSYPGVILSGDDIYLMSSGLATLETTIGNNNPNLWKYVNPQSSVLEGFRNLIANRLSNTGKEWTSIFSQFNSGTYNNEWLVVNYKQFTPGKETQGEGLFYLLDQIPGNIVSRDMTQEFLKQSYWPSYNIPYFVEIFNKSGGSESVEKFGNWFSYDSTARANIFRRDHSKVTDIKTMTSLMRYNNFKKDPLSACNCTPPYSGENGISARCDLNPASGKWPFSALGHRDHVGTDMKVTSYSLMKTLSMVAVSGPTWDQQPAFRWSESDYRNTRSHIGHPDLFKFTPIQWP